MDYLRSRRSKSQSLLVAGTATPAVCAIDGRQFVVISTSNARNGRAPQGSALLAFALPKRILPFQGESHMKALKACSPMLVAVALSGLTAAGAIAADAAPVNPLGLKAHHITAAVSDMDRAVRWYREVLGFAVTEQGSRGNSGMKVAELAIPGFGVALIQLPPGVGKVRGIYAAMHYLGPTVAAPNWPPYDGNFPPGAAP